MSLTKPRWAELNFRDPDPLTGEPSLSLELFHEASHDGGNRPRFQLSCGHDARHVGTDSVDLAAYRACHWGRAATRAAPTRPAQTAAAGPSIFRRTRTRSVIWSVFSRKGVP